MLQGCMFARVAFVAFACCPVHPSYQHGAQQHTLGCFAVAKETTPSPSYHYSLGGDQDSCSAGTKITTAAACQTAATDIRYQYYSLFNGRPGVSYGGFDGSYDSTTKPSGCVLTTIETGSGFNTYYSMSVIFNNNLIGGRRDPTYVGFLAQPICGGARRPDPHVRSLQRARA
jgi:hypothetical protein